MSKSDSTFLEVDSNIFERNLLLKDDSNGGDDLGNLLGFNQKKSKDDQPWKLVTPSAGLVIKTADEKGKKIFINLCKIDDIPEPKDISEEELLSIWRSGDATDYRVPISMQEPHEELDKSGNEAVVYDVAINTKFFKKIEENSLFRCFVIQIVQDGLEDKYNIVLKKEGYVILKNRTRIGELMPHRVRIFKGPYHPPKRLIEEVKPSNRVTGREDSTKEVNRNINYRLLHGNNILIGQFHIPQAKTAKEIKLDVGENRIIVESSSNNYSAADVFLPCKVDEGKAVAHFSLLKKMLTVLIPVA